MADYSQSDLNTLNGFITNAEAALTSGDTQNAINDVDLYYDDQVGKRGYAADALEVVNDTGVFGLVAPVRSSSLLNDGRQNTRLTCGLWLADPERICMFRLKFRNVLRTIEVDFLIVNHV